MAMCMRAWRRDGAEPISIGHNATCSRGRLLRQHNVRALVVTNDDGTYRGLITTRGRRALHRRHRRREDGGRTRWRSR
ncbi:MAG: hypothetical protein ACLTMP_02150 [Eggerthella lenta]